MAKRQRTIPAAASRAERRWILGQVKGLQNALGQAIARLEAIGETPPPSPVPIQVIRPAGAAAPIEQLQEQIDHLHYDLVAIRAHLDIPNPGCASAEEHTEP